MTEPFYNLPREVIDDADLYRLEVERAGKGEVPPGKLKPFRVARGIYAQRGQVRYMTRIKVPGGGLTPEQMIKIADLSEKYGNGIPHVTSRQDVQLHNVTLEDTAKAIGELLEVGLTTRGGGGNTVRNITACPDAGVCGLEVFDVSPYAPAFTEFFLTHAKAYTLPRKFKIAFSGCSDDCSLSTVNDVGFIAKKKAVEGVEKRGFRVYAAGGMGAKSRVAELIEDFIPEEDAIYVAEALMLLFDKYGNRKNKHKARLRFVIDKLGRDEFIKRYREELAAVKKDGPRNIDLKQRAVPEKNLSSELKEIPPVSDKGFDLWRRTNVRPQKDEGYYFAKIRLPLGDISAENFRNLAAIAGRFGEGNIRTTHDQNIMVRWLKGSEVYPFYQALSEIGLAAYGAGGPSDILSCPGASTCNLGLCLSKNLSTVVTEKLEGSGLPIEAMQDIKIRVSGCPNSCGQHPIGGIGLFGAAKRSGERMAPHYNILLGGRVEEGYTALAEEYGFVPAKKVPDLIEDFLAQYNKSRAEEEDFYAWLDRCGKAWMREHIQDYNLPAYEEDPDYYRDWGMDEEFSLAGLGPGECGAGVLDMIEADIDDGKRQIFKARNDLSEGRPEAASAALFKAIGVTTKALLVARGIEPSDDYQAVTEFEKQFIQKKLIDGRFFGLKKRWAKYLSGLLDKEGLTEEITFMEDLSKEVSDLYGTMDANMKFEAEKNTEEKEKPAEEDKEKTKKESPEGEVGTDAFMDLRGVKCPINYVKAKIKLETMAPGQTLQLYLDDGEPIRNVPNSLKNDGQEILKMKQVGEYFDLIVKKAA